MSGPRRPSAHGGPPPLRREGGPQQLRKVFTVAQPQVRILSGPNTKAHGKILAQLLAADALEGNTADLADALAPLTESINSGLIAAVLAKHKNLAIPTMAADLLDAESGSGEAGIEPAASPDIHRTIIDASLPQEPLAGGGLETPGAGVTGETRTENQNRLANRIAQNIVALEAASQLNNTRVLEDPSDVLAAIIDYERVKGKTIDELETEASTVGFMPIISILKELRAKASAQIAEAYVTCAVSLGEEVGTKPVTINQEMANILRSVRPTDLQDQADLLEAIRRKGLVFEEGVMTAQDFFTVILPELVKASTLRLDAQFLLDKSEGVGLNANNEATVARTLDALAASSSVDEAETTQRTLFGTGNDQRLPAPAGEAVDQEAPTRQVDVDGRASALPNLAGLSPRRSRPDEEVEAGLRSLQVEEELETMRAQVATERAAPAPESTRPDAPGAYTEQQPPMPAEPAPPAAAETSTEAGLLPIRGMDELTQRAETAERRLAEETTRADRAVRANAAAKLEITGLQQKRDEHAQRADNAEGRIEMLERQAQPLLEERTRLRAEVDTARAANAARRALALGTFGVERVEEIEETAAIAKLDALLTTDTLPAGLPFSEVVALMKETTNETLHQLARAYAIEFNEAAGITKEEA